MTKRRLFGLPLPLGVTVYIFLPSFFICLLVVGIYGDIKHWWSDLPYVTNMLTTLTGACIGVPFAVGVIQQLTRRQASDLDWSSTVRLLNDAVSQIRTALVTAYAGGLEELESFRSLLSFCCERSEQLTSYAKYIRVLDTDGTREYMVEELLADEYRRFIRDLESLKVGANWLRQKSTGNPSSDLSAMYLSAWESLDEHVRPRVQEKLGCWIPMESYLRLRRQLGFSWIEDIDIANSVDVLIAQFEQAMRISSFYDLRILKVTPGFDASSQALRVARGHIDGYLVLRRELAEFESIAALANLGRRATG